MNCIEKENARQWERWKMIEIDQASLAYEGESEAGNARKTYQYWQNGKRGGTDFAVLGILLPN